MIYAPNDDSFLLEEQVKKYAKGKKVLDIGTGSGIQAIAAKNAGAKSVLASDINQEALKIKNIHLVHSDLFNNIKGKFDLIIFNPPYLPLDIREDKVSQIATTGGKRGDELIIKFLKQAPKHLEKEGIILLLVSSLTPQYKINQILNKQNLKKEILSSKKIFFETLQVLKISLFDLC